MYIMWKDRSNSISPRLAWKKISKTKAEQYLRNHFSGEAYEEAVLKIALDQVVETTTFCLKA